MAAAGRSCRWYLAAELDGGEQVEGEQVLEVVGAFEVGEVADGPVPALLTRTSTGPWAFSTSRIREQGVAVG